MQNILELKKESNGQEFLLRTVCGHPVSTKSNLPKIWGDKEDEKASQSDIRDTETRAWEAWHYSVSASVVNPKVRQTPIKTSDDTTLILSGRQENDS